MLTGPLLIGVFLLAIAILLVSIIKFRLNAFIALLITSLVTSILVGMPIGDIASTISGGFGSTLSGIGIVTGLGVMLGKFMFESGAIETISNSILNKFGEKNSPAAIAISGFLTGIPVFGDVVYIMFAPMLRVLSRKTNISMVTFACAISVATTCTYSLVIPTPAPLVVSESLGIDVGIFFVYAILTAFVATTTGGILYGKFLDKQDKKIPAKPIPEHMIKRFAYRLEEMSKDFKERNLILYRLGIGTGYRMQDLVDLTIGDIREALEIGYFEIHEKKQYNAYLTHIKKNPNSKRKPPKKRKAIISSSLKIALIDYVKGKRKSQYALYQW